MGQCLRGYCEFISTSRNEVSAIEVDVRTAIWVFLFLDLFLHFATRNYRNKEKKTGQDETESEGGLY